MVTTHQVIVLSLKLDRGRHCEDVGQTRSSCVLVGELAKNDKACELEEYKYYQMVPSAAFIVSARCLVTSAIIVIIEPAFCIITIADKTHKS